MGGFAGKQAPGLNNENHPFALLQPFDEVVGFGFSNNGPHTARRQGGQYRAKRG